MSHAYTYNGKIIYNNYIYEINKPLKTCKTYSSSPSCLKTFSTQLFLYIKLFKGYNHDQSQSDIYDVFLNFFCVVSVAYKLRNIMDIFYYRNIKTWM